MKEELSGMLSRGKTAVLAVILAVVLVAAPPPWRPTASRSSWARGT
jgi:hypothetical protein